MWSRWLIWGGGWFNWIHLLLWAAWNILKTGLCYRTAAQPQGNIFWVVCWGGWLTWYLILWWNWKKCLTRWGKKLITMPHAVDGGRINLSKNPFLNATARLLNLLCAVYWGQLVDVFAAPPKLWKTKQCEVMSLLLLMQTSCVALWEAWDLNSVCVSTQVGSMCAHTFSPFFLYVMQNESNTVKYVKKSSLFMYFI